MSCLCFDRFHARPLYLLAACLSCLPLLSSAQGDSAGIPDRPAFTIKANVPYYFIGGYHVEPSVHFRGHWSVSATVQGIAEIPDFARDQFFDVSDDAIAVEWPYAIGAEVMYRLREGAYDGGFFVTAGLGYEGWRIRHDAEPVPEETLTNAFAAVDLGYTWYPFKRQRFHGTVQYPLIWLLNNTDRRAIGGDTYELQTVVPPGLLPNILFGWRF